MPKTPQDFSKALIYSIVCKTDETLLYIGSTTNFTKRKNKHKTACCDETFKGHNRPVYVMIRANGGWENFNMRPVKEFPCESKIQLVIEEERMRKEVKANLNTNRAYVSPEERKREHVEYIREHAVKIAEDGKKYREANAAKLAENRKKYQEANKAKINERKRRYYQEKKQRLAEQNKTEK